MSGTNPISLEEKTALRPNHLIIVCCHAIYLDPPTTSREISGQATAASSANILPSHDESNWLIEPFQQGETQTYIRHAEAGVRALASDERAILVFSGGATKPKRSEKTEGDGYMAVALEHSLFGFSGLDLERRMFVDRFATDSYQNVLLSLVQYPLFARGIDGASNTTPDVSTFPNKITIVSHEFKRSRFLDLHLSALGWKGETEFIGINPPFDPVKMAEIEEGDRLRGYGAWEKDLHGVGSALVNKKISRGWNQEAFRTEVLNRLGGTVMKEQLENLVFLQDAGQDLTLPFRGKIPWA